MMISDNLSKLTEKDILNLSLYCIYRLSNKPEYAAISELIYTLDKDNFYKLVSEFGGTTIRIPTLKEIKVAMKALVLYQEVNNGKPLEIALDKLEVTKDERPEVLNMFEFFDSVVGDYNE